MFFMDAIVVATILMIFAIALAIIEMFFPGFGFFGVSAVILFTISSILFILNVWWGIFVVFGVAIALAVLIVIAVKSAKTREDIFHSENLKEDTESVKIPQNYVGKEGITTTPLRPFGFANIEDNILQVCSEGGKFVESSEKVTIIGISDNNIVVRPESFKISY